MEIANLPDLLIWFVAFLLSFTTHEAAHAWVAKSGGDLTAYNGGQVTLNPIPHIKRSPIGMIVVPLISYVMAGWMIGWASAPYDPDWAMRYPKRAAWMAAAGPAANFVIMAVTFLLLKIGLFSGTFEMPGQEELFLNGRLQLANVAVSAHVGWSGVAKLLSVLYMLNMILLIFNLLPFPPLDGSTVINLFLSDDAGRRLSTFLRQPMYTFLGIIIAWRILNTIFQDIFLFFYSLLHPNFF